MSHRPDFVIAGSAKSGTTALHMMLDQHPQAYLSPIKETNFFIHGYEPTRQFVGHRGENVLAGQEESDVIDTHDKYAALFANAGPDTICGEASPWYLINRAVPERIRAHRADTKIVIILRNPADVAFANFVHQVRDRAESLRIDQIDSVFDPAHYERENLYPFCDHLNLPRYAQHLPAWLDTFEPDQLHIMVYEEFRQDRRGQLANLFNFLTLDNDVNIDVERRVNISGLPKSEAAQSLLQGSLGFKKILRLFIPKKPRRKIRAMLEALNTGKRVKMSTSVRERFDEIYRDDIAFVEDLLKRKLSAWR